MRTTPEEQLLHTLASQLVTAPDNAAIHISLALKERGALVRALQMQASRQCEHLGAPWCDLLEPAHVADMAQGILQIRLRQTSWGSHPATVVAALRFEVHGAVERTITSVVGNSRAPHPSPVVDTGYLGVIVPSPGADDFHVHCVGHDATRIALSPRELCVLYQLWKARGQAIPARELCARALGSTGRAVDARNVLYQHVHHLRHKISPLALAIANRRMRGYALVATTNSDNCVPHGRAAHSARYRTAPIASD